MCLFLPAKRPRTVPNNKGGRLLSGRLCRNVDTFTKRLNTPVQGAAADGVKHALALLWETRDRCPSARVVLVVHDEIVLEVPEEDAEKAREWLTGCMLRGMREVVEGVPIKVDAKVGRSWADK